MPSGFNHQHLVDWLTSVLNCPLNQDFDALNAPAITSTSNQGAKHALCLSDLANSQTMREAEFYFPLYKAKTEQLVNLLTDHRNRARAKIYANGFELVSSSQIQLNISEQLNGMMHGYIDLIFEHQGKYYIADHKSNFLGNDFQDYQKHQMQENIETHHYDLQYLIYALALHRYLASSLEDYSIDEHFGGVYYFYLRGMSSDDQNRGCGVYFQSIEADELAKLDQLFAGQPTGTPNSLTSTLGAKT